MAESKPSTKSDISKTGIEELDHILNGGIPRGSIILLAGASGTGKTTLALQWLYGGISKYNETGIYFTLTESITKVIKHVSSFSFYEAARRGSNVHFSDLRSLLRLLHLSEKRISYEDMEKLLETIRNVVKKTKAKRLVLDSVTALCYILHREDMIRQFIFRLGNILSELGCMSFLVSEVPTGEYSIFGVEEFICDGIIKLEQQSQGDNIIRLLKIAKMRGVLYNPRLHKFRITRDGVFILRQVKPELDFQSFKTLVTSGIKGLDKMLEGGYFKGSSTLVAGPAGTGKSLFGIQFLHEGLKRNEPGVLVSFEESEAQVLRNASTIGCSLKKYLDNGLFVLLSYYPDKYLPEENLINIANAVEKIKAKRCVIDSLSCIAGAIPAMDYKGFVRHLITYLKGRGITTLFTTATTRLTGSTNIAEMPVSTLTDNIVLLKYLEVRGCMKLMIAILKTRGADHDKSLRGYTITGKGLIVGEAYTNLEGIMTGVARRISESIEERLEAEFIKFIGPMATSAFLELKNKGLTKTNIFIYIDELTSQKILEKKDVKLFKQNVNDIIQGSEPEGN